MIGKEGGVLKAWEATVKKTHAVAKKRANSIFGTITIGHVEEDHHQENNNNNGSNRVAEENGSSEPLEVYHEEKFLPNGDYYTGEWAESFPHGFGKYLWLDGCMYVGDWYKGKKTGRGTFSWPSGATYEGEFKNGFMDGTGVYTSANGDTYKGQWVMNLKQGHGFKSFSNGDWYDGDWKKDVTEGKGRYEWKDESHYFGEWKNGIISGKGMFVFHNGNKFEGHWEDGVPKGTGTFKWPDGCYYAGNWSRDGRDQDGTYHPSESLDEEEDGHCHAHWEPSELYTALSYYRVGRGEKVPVLPSQKKLAIWRSSKGGESGKPRRMSVDGRVSLGSDRSSDRWHDGGEGEAPIPPPKTPPKAATDLDEELMNIQIEDESTGPLKPLKAPKKAKRQGETICKGHKNYELMLNLQLGIRHSVARPAPSASLDLKPSAFDPKEKVWTRFPPEGSKYTPPHPSAEFKWKDYCPVVFRALRKLFKVDPADYMLSICGNEALRELCSPGKSGSFFYLTNDDRYMIKTMKKAEVKALLRMLPAYYTHFRTYQSTMVTKYYGLHCVKLTGHIQRKVRFIIMGNLFRSKYNTHRRYDLKGSSLGRTTDKPETEISETTILKDLDLNFIFRLQPSRFEEFCSQIDRDCELLEQEGIMDYSLLVGIHFRHISPDGELVPCGSENLIGKAKNDPDPPSALLGVNMPARVERTVRKRSSELQLVGEPIGEFYDVILHFGIIDILQDYDISKKIEHAYKSMQYDSTSISAVDPRLYSRRFRDFIFRIFTEDSS